MLASWQPAEGMQGYLQAMDASTGPAGHAGGYGAASHIGAYGAPHAGDYGGGGGYMDPMMRSFGGPGGVMMGGAGNGMMGSFGGPGGYGGMAGHPHQMAASGLGWNSRQPGL